MPCRNFLEHSHIHYGPLQKELNNREKCGNIVQKKISFYNFHILRYKIKRKKEMNFAAKWFRRSADFILWARHRRGGAGLRGNKIYTLRRQERSPILVAMVVQQMVEWEYWRKYPRANMMRPLLSPLSKDIRAQRNVTQVRNTNWFQNSVLISWQELRS